MLSPAYISLPCIFLRLIRAGELYIKTWPCAILFHCFMPLAKASSALPVSINLCSGNNLVSTWACFGSHR